MRQGGSLCEYGNQADEMCRDKFIFGLHQENMRTELLKTHMKVDKTQKTLFDVARDAKAMEAAQQTNKIIVEETVNYTKQATKFTRHADMCLKRELKTCHWCGDTKGPHQWNTCPAKGKVCSKCGGNYHFAIVCLQTTPNTKMSHNTNKQLPNQLVITNTNRDTTLLTNHLDHKITRSNKDIHKMSML